MKRHLTLVSALVVTSACAHKPAAESPPIDEKARASCEKAAVDSLAPRLRDSVRIACNGYQFQVAPRTPKAQ